MTAVAPAATESPELAEFRAEVKAWLEANVERRSTDSSDFKKKFAVSHQTREEELAATEASKRWQGKIYDAGFAGLTVAPEYGGRGLTNAHERIWRQESGRYAIDTGVFAVGLGMVVPTILVHGTEEQKKEYVPPLIRGEKVWCQLFSEPGAGSDLAGLTTRAERDGETWIVNGQKVWNSYAHVADWGILLARTDWDVPKHRGISYFLVDMTHPRRRGAAPAPDHRRRPLQRDVPHRRPHPGGEPARRAQQRVGGRADDVDERARAHRHLGWRRPGLSRLDRARQATTASSATPRSASASPSCTRAASC